MKIITKDDIVVVTDKEDCWFKKRCLVLDITNAYCNGITYSVPAKVLLISEGDPFRRWVEVSKLKKIKVGGRKIKYEFKSPKTVGSWVVMIFCICSSLLLFGSLIYLALK